MWDLCHCWWGLWEEKPSLFTAAVGWPEEATLDIGIYTGPQNTKNRSRLWPSGTAPGSMSDGQHTTQPQLTFVTQLSYDASLGTQQWTDKQNVANVHNRTLKLWRMKLWHFSGKQMKLEMTVLSKIHQIQTNTTLSHMKSRCKYLNIHLNIYIWREREREREQKLKKGLWE